VPTLVRIVAVLFICMSSLHPGFCGASGFGRRAGRPLPASRL